jgi:PTH1 family peptidyl-tRNA hydrolase
MDTPTRLIVGLGNPGREYERTRHNVGFMVVDAFARTHRIPVTRRDFRALAGDGRVGGTRVFLLKPQTFMNNSGQSVAAFLRQKPLPLSDIMVVVDDIALPLARLRLRAGGSAGGHNGLKSLIAHLHSHDFPRLRFGVGAPHDASVQIDFVLGPFNRREMAEVEHGVERSVAALENWLEEGIEPAMNRFNG